MKIYTRRGDGGETGLYGGGRISKDHVRIEATGAVDELNALLGRALCSVGEGRIRSRIPILQDDLFSIGSRIASRVEGGGDAPRRHLPPLPAHRPSEMEGWIDEISDELEPLKNFILPGGSPGAADLHVARTVCRRAERRVVTLAAEDGVEPEILRYLNRLSDLLFAFGRLENRYQGRADVEWHPSGETDEG